MKKMQQIYLDHNATTPLHPEVQKAMCSAMDVFGNPSSLHTFGREARRMIEKSREQVASFINAAPHEITFSGSGSEANNAVLSLMGCSSHHCRGKNRGKTGILTTKIEHPCILETAQCISDGGTHVIFLDVDKYGKIHPDRLESAINDSIGLVSVMMANNEIGTLQDIKTLAQISHGKKVLFHTDAVQAVGKVPIDVKELDVDFLTLSAHKLYGPKGIGALYIRKGIPFCPLIRGGHQENGRRAGTENTIGIVALGTAVEMRKQEMKEEEQRLTHLKQMLRKGIEAAIPDVFFNGHPEESLVSTLNVSFDGAEGEAILLYLDLEGVAVSTGSACASGSLEPSHVLLATGVPIERAHGSIRFSMGRGTTEDEIRQVLNILPGIIAKIRGMSTAYSK